MPTAHRQIASAARAAWEHATTLLLAARVEGAWRDDLDALADYADEQRDRWLRAEQCARRNDDRAYSPFPSSDYSADPFGEPGVDR
ncbi:hypothetical protein [Aureimonas sp. N4]|uniref:hypothetical protein n=1 Tax=Aureimonas sp. N4 TaxID=1638165 RepID=UPI000782D05D|nr:hypothetical protein [Aureimonas sp. N4]